MSSRAGSRARALVSFGVLLGLSGLLTGCPTPPTPAEMASDAARELNLSARWGRLDLAVTRASEESRSKFLANRSGWGSEVRVLDTVLAGLELPDATHATVQVDVSWVHEDETTLRVTRLEQAWTDSAGKWQMQSEKRIGGDLGLFGEEVTREGPPPDTHYPTRVIR